MPLNDFIIGELIGKGTFSSVCLVKRKIDNQTYAMKRVKIVQLQEKEKQNALNEIRILASLNHKNIIGYKEAFFDEQSQTLNIIMEYANDGDLSTKIKYNLKNGLIFREDIIWSYIIQILEGINYLHENKIIHRDLKSANLFLMDDGTLKIGDLNVSKIAKMGIAFTQAGTPYYASPEVWLDESYDNKSDIWSIGCIIYELCMLKTPFRGTSMKNLCLNIQKGEYSDISKFYSNDLRNIISMMLIVNPENRFSAQQILNCDFVLRKRKENGGKKFVKEEKANLIQTIKMPKNLKEINRNLPMNKYNKKQNEEMLMNDEYETMKNGFLNNEKKDKIKKYLQEKDMYKQINMKNNNINNYNYKNQHKNRKNNIIKNQWEKDNYKHNYEYYRKQMELNNYNNNHSQNSNNKRNEIANYKKININNKNILEKINQVKTPSSISPSKKHINNNIYNNKICNGRKINISQKSRPKTGNNVIYKNNNSVNYNRVNKSNKIMIIDRLKNNKSKNQNRPISAIPYRKGYIYRININNNNIKENNNVKKRPNTGSIHNRNSNIQKKNDNLPKNLHQYRYININNQNLNINYLKNEKDRIILNPKNNKKERVIIEKLDYKSMNKNKNIKRHLNNFQKGKNERINDYEEKVKNRINKNNINIMNNKNNYIKKHNK